MENNTGVKSLSKLIALKTLSIFFNSKKIGTSLQFSWSGEWWKSKRTVFCFNFSLTKFYLRAKCNLKDTTKHLHGLFKRQVTIFYWFCNCLQKLNLWERELHKSTQQNTWKHIWKIFKYSGVRWNTVAPWCNGYYYCTTTFSKVWTQILRRFKTCLRWVGGLRWWESLTMVPAGNKA